MNTKRPRVCFLIGLAVTLTALFSSSGALSPSAATSQANRGGLPMPPGLEGAREVAALRTENSRVFDTASGSRVALIWSRPIIDPGDVFPGADALRFEADAAGWVSRGSRLRVTLPLTHGGPARVETKRGAGLTWVPFHAAVHTGGAETTVLRSRDPLSLAPGSFGAAANTIDYGGSFAGVDDRFVLTRTGLKHDHIVHANPAPGRPSSAGEFLEFGVRVLVDAGVTLTADGRPVTSETVTGADVEVRLDGAPLFYIKSPVAREVRPPAQRCDAASVPGRLRLVPAAGGAFVYVGVPMAWLAEPGRVFPVDVDPTIDIAPTPYDSSTQSVGGCCPDPGCFPHNVSDIYGYVYFNEGDQSTPDLHRTWMIFDTSAIPDGSTITDVKLVYTVIEEPFDNIHPRDTNIEIHNLETDFRKAPPTEIQACNKTENGTVFTSGRFLQSAGTHSVNLGSAAETKMQNQLPQDWFGVVWNVPAATPDLPAFERGAVEINTFNDETLIEVTFVDDNLPPVCDAGPDQAKDCEGPTTQVKLDGSGSYDPDSNPLTWRWTGPFTPSPTTGATPTVTFTGNGTFTVTLQVSDGSDTSTCTTRVTIRKTPLHIECPADTSAEAGAGCVTWFDLLATAGGGCDNAIVITNDRTANGPDASDNYPLGTTTVTFTATSGSDTVSCSTAVTVVDTVAPVPACKGPVTLGTGPGDDDCRVAYSPEPPVVTEACPFTLGNDAPALFPLGDTTVTWIATDSSNNAGSCTQVVTVVDDTKPVLACPADVTLETGPGDDDCKVAYDPAANATDNCDTSVAVTDDAPAEFGIGDTVVTFDAVDDAGNSAACSMTVTVIDTTAPVMSCPADVTATTSGDGGGDCTVRVTLKAQAIDNCGGVTITNDRTGGGDDATDDYPVGTTVVTFKGRDTAGNEATCAAKVTVVDDTKPALACPADVTARTSDDGGGDCQVRVTLKAPATDNCGAVTVTNDRTGGGDDATDEYPVGTTVVTFKARDTAGNETACAAKVTVIDDTTPVLACPADVTARTSDDGGGDCQVRVTFKAQATDNCATVTVTNDRTGGGDDATDEYPVGTTVVTFKARDTAGNEATCSAKVIVIDDTKPVLACPADVTAYTSGDGGGDCQVRVTLKAVATDNCGAVTVTNDRTGGGDDATDDYPVGTTVVTFKARDTAGNESTCAAKVTVIDDTKPALACPADKTAYTSDDGGGDCQVRVTLKAQATDNCGAVTVTNDRTGGGDDATDDYPVGTTVVTFKARDTAGNETTCAAKVTVIDDTKPVLACPADVTVTTSSDGGADCQVRVMLKALATDNCGAVTVTNDRTGGGDDATDDYPVGTTVVMFKARDTAGNESTCAARVTVIDDTKPVLACPADVTVTTSSDGGGDCKVRVAVRAVATDNCGAVMVTNDRTGGGDDATDDYSRGVTVVTFTARDTAGNETTCTAKVTVIDDTCPVINNLADLRSTIESKCFFTEPTVPAAVTDNCDAAPGFQALFADVAGTDCGREITLLATDVFGNGCPETIRYFEDPNDCDHDGVPDCPSCDLHYDMACFAVNKGKVGKAAAAPGDPPDDPADETADETPDPDPADETAEFEGSMALAACPYAVSDEASDDASDEASDESPDGIAALLSPDDRVRFTLDAEVKPNEPPIGGVMLCDVRFGDFETKGKGRYRYRLETGPRLDIELDFVHCGFSFTGKGIDLSTVSGPEISLVLEIGRHLGTSTDIYEDKRKHWKLDRKPAVSCCSKKS